MYDCFLFFFARSILLSAERFNKKAIVTPNNIAIKLLSFIWLVISEIGEIKLAICPCAAKEKSALTATIEFFISFILTRFYWCTGNLISEGVMPPILRNRACKVFGRK